MSINETNIFGFMYEQYHLPNKPKLFEAFSGIGCQRMAFDRLGIEYEMVGISEIDKYAIQSYVAIHGDTKNYGSICDIKGKDLSQIDLFTYSFPCTDLSKAGKQKGLNDTRSGLVYEVLRILQQLNDLDRLPKVLIMENVVDLVQTKFIRQFQEIQLELEELGYSNYTETLNAKDFGVAQNRDRVFMVSILGEYSYEFPKPIKLEKRLKDYLEDSVDEKYYLSDKLLNFFISNSEKNKEKGNGFRFKPRSEEDVAVALTTNTGNRMDDNFITIPEATEKGYAEARDGDGVVQKGMIQTLKTSGTDIGVVVEDIIIGSAQKNAYKDNLNGHCSALTSAMGMGGGQIPMVTENNRLRIRKLIPKECWRLMGINDECFNKAEKVCSNSQLYKQAGNGIVVNVFAAIVKNLI